MFRRCSKSRGSCKVRNEAETKHSETKRNTTKRNEIRQNETKYVNWETKRNRICKLRNKTKRNKIIQWVLKRKAFLVVRVRLTLSVPDSKLYIARNDRWFAHLHIQNGGSKRIWILTYSWMGNFLLAWAGQFSGIKN